MPGESFNYFDIPRFKHIPQRIGESMKKCFSCTVNGNFCKLNKCQTGGYINDRIQGGQTKEWVSEVYRILKFVVITALAF